MPTAVPTLVVWLFGITLLVVMALFGTVWYQWRETVKRFSDQDRRFTDVASTMASVVKTAEIYERTQERAAETFARTHDSLLGTLREMTKSNHETQRTADTRFAELGERSTNHGQELRRIAENVHNVRTECRNALEKNVSELREHIARVAQTHHDDMARLQVRRQGDEI